MAQEALTVMPGRGLADSARLLPLAVGMAMVDAPWSHAPELGCLVIIALLCLRPRRFPVRGSLLVTLLTTWLFLSTSWSLLPGSTVKASVRTGLVLGAAAMLVHTLPGRRIMAVVSQGTSLLCAMSLVWLALFPATSIDADGLRGMMPQNNALAYVTAVALVSTVVADLYPRWLRAAVLLVDVVTLVLTDSMTSLLAAVAALVAAAAATASVRLGSRARQALTALVGGLVLALGCVASFVPMASLLGRDATLTGRTDIWHDLWPVALRRWAVGWGHGAPWLQGSWIRDWAAFHFNFSMISAHNSLLETFLQLGLVGVVLTLLLWGRAVPRILHGAYRSSANAWLAALASLQLVHGLAEATQGAPLGWLVTALLWMAHPVGVPRIPRRPAEPRPVAGNPVAASALE